MIDADSLRARVDPTGEGEGIGGVKERQPNRGPTIPARRSLPSNHSKSWLFTSAAQNFAINRIYRHLCATFADPDGMALGSSIHLGQ
jgi:hypothetical protein